jgi:hypothetical protein
MIDPDRDANDTVGADSSEADFRSQVHDALVHLYEPGALAASPLARLNRSQPRGQMVSPAKALQRTLLDAIDELRPEHGRGGGRAARHHQLLTLRYVEGAPIAAIQRQLALSRSEYFREHGRALDAVAAVLSQQWERAADPPTDVGITASLASLIDQLQQQLGAGLDLNDSARLITLGGQHRAAIVIVALTPACDHVLPS